MEQNYYGTPQIIYGVKKHLKKMPQKLEALISDEINHEDEGPLLLGCNHSNRCLD